MVYLDANATEPLRPEARAAMLAALDVTGNPSSVHAAGRAARRILEDAREALAARFGALAQNLVFTSGGTEADALAIHALGAGRRVIVGATEHDAVRAAAPAASSLPVDRDGVADLDALAAWLADGPPALVCLMLANNETGTIQPIAEAAELCRRHGAWLHVDAVQAAGRIDVRLSALGAHSIAISSHKLGGPLGAGALLLAPEVASIAPLIAGGGQERGRRGGTPPLPAIAGFAAAASVGADGAALAPLARCGRGGGGRGRRRRVRRRSGATGQHHLPCPARHTRRCTGDRARPGRDRGQCRRGVQFRQGDREPRAGGDGPRRARRPGDPGLAAVERDRGRRRRLRRRIPAHGGPAARGAGTTRRLNPHWPP